MHTLTHFVLNTILGLILGFDIQTSLIMGVAAMVIDLDHFIYYIYKRKPLSQILRAGTKHWLLYKPRFFIFHTIEFNLLIALLGFINPIFFIIALSLIIHVACDGYDYFIHIKDRKWVETWTATYYLWTYFSRKTKKKAVV